MKKFPYIWIFLLVLYGCIEEIPIETQLKTNLIAEDVLVVEATITDEFKNQEVFLSRGKSFANDRTSNKERNAEVVVNNEQGESFRFFEQEPGRYVSESAFAAQIGVEYQLAIMTSNGASYQSETNRVMGSSTIDNIYAERITSDNGAEGMAIFVDSSNPEESLNDYRYTYEETYKIIAPNWNPLEFQVTREQIETIFDPSTGEVLEVLFPDVTLVPRTQEEQTCFNTVFSNEIILSNGTVLNDNEVQGNLIRFINRQNPILSHRYSILVKQFLQSIEAGKFYRTLQQFSQIENLFSEVQPGFLEGNISAVENENAPAIGFFNVASVTEKRLFFSYEDFFLGEPLPPYFGTVNCSAFIAPRLGNPERDGPVPPGPAGCGGALSLTELIALQDIAYYDFSNIGLCQGTYFVTQRECGDCTALGSNVVPEFWIEE
ncbi:MAG: DUF4249 domain-containing protein [Croceivirga sp.]